MSVMSANTLSSARKTSLSTASSQATKEWIKLFPRQVTQSYSTSVAFMKQLTVIAVSTITYLKEIFPKESYLTETFGGVGLRILKTKCEDESAQFISTSLVQSFEALEKKYLDKLVLCLYEGSCHEDSLVEAHSFEFTYSAAGVSLDVRSAGRDGGAARSAPDGGTSHAARFTFENIRESTLDLLKSCIDMSQTTHREMQEPYDISLRLYYNNAAPAGYQAAGFAAAAPEREPPPGALRAAPPAPAVATPYHRLVARAYFRDIASSHEANASQNVPVMTQYENDNLSSDPQVSPSHAGDRPAPALRCACGALGAAPGLARAPLLTCYYCGTRQHAACYGRAARAARAHVCTRCAELRPARAPSCADLAKLSPRRGEMLCLYRHSLLWAAGERRLLASAFRARFQLSATVAHKLLKNLHSKGVLRGNLDDPDSPLEIDREGLRTMINSYFQSDEDEMVERLLAESLSQEGTPDPVGDMLEPVDQISLQNAATMGKIIQHTPPDNDVEDSTLKQYREAIFTTNKNSDEELPLSGSHNPVQNIGKREKTVTKRKMDDPDTKQPRSRLRTKKTKPMP